MNRKAAIVASRFWPEVLAAVAPLVLFLPFVIITGKWISLTLHWFKTGTMKWLLQTLGETFVHLCFHLPEFGITALLGLVFAAAAKRRGLRLAYIFGLSMFLSQTTVTLLGRGPEWHLCLVNLGYILFPVAAAWALLRAVRPTPAGCCHRCGYDLTGNESGVCPECGKEL